MELGVGWVFFVLLLVLLMVVLVLVVICYLWCFDEMVWCIYFEVFVLVFVGIVLFIFVYGFFEIIGFLKFLMFFVWFLMGVFWVIGCVLGLRCYVWGIVFVSCVWSVVGYRWSWLESWRYCGRWWMLLKLVVMI